MKACFLTLQYAQKHTYVGVSHPMPSVTPGIFIHSHDALLLYIFQAYNKNVLSYAHCYLYSLLYLNTRPRKANCDSKKNFLATICISKNVKKFDHYLRKTFLFDNSIFSFKQNSKQGSCQNNMSYCFTRFLHFLIIDDMAIGVYRTNIFNFYNHT